MERENHPLEEMLEKQETDLKKDSDEIHDSKEEMKLTEETPAKKRNVEAKKNPREKINFLPLEISLNTKFKSFITEWKQKEEKKTALFSKTEATELLDWMLKEKSSDISAKEYNKLQEAYLDLTSIIPSEAKKIEIESQKKEQQKKDEKEIDVAREKIHRVIMNEASELDEIQKQLELHRQEIKKNFGISFDEFNTPATPADNEKIEKLLALSEKNPETKQSFWGKIKNVFTSSENIKNAQNFKKDFEDYQRIVKELPDRVQMKTTGGTIGRSMIRERGSVGTSVGTIETTRHTPLRRETPKRGRPRKKPVS